MFWVLIALGGLLFFATIWLGFQFQKTVALKQAGTEAGSIVDSQHLDASLLGLAESPINKSSHNSSVKMSNSSVTQAHSSISSMQAGSTGLEAASPVGAPIDLMEIRRSRFSAVNEAAAGQVNSLNTPQRVDTPQLAKTPSSSYQARLPEANSAPEYAQTTEPFVSEEPLASEPDYSDLPYLNELASHDRSDIPPFQFSSHMFSSSADYRTVVINGASLKQGDRFGRGLIVEAITEEGVVIDKDGLQFRINVMQEWTFE